MSTASTRLTRVTAAVAGTVLLLGGLTACGSDDDDPAAADDGAVATDTATGEASPGDEGEADENADGGAEGGDGTDDGGDGAHSGEGGEPGASGGPRTATGERLCPESVAHIPEAQYGPLSYPPEPGAPEISQGDFVDAYVAVVEECGVQHSIPDQYADAREQISGATASMCTPDSGEEEVARARAILGGVLVLTRGFDGTEFSALRCDNGTTVVPQMPF